MLLGIFVLESLVLLIYGWCFWRKKKWVPSIQCEITPSIWVGNWCACDLGASLEVSFCLGFKILLHYSSYVGFLFEFEFYGLFRVPFWVLILGYCFGF